MGSDSNDLRLRRDDLIVLCATSPYTTIKFVAMKPRPTSIMLQYIDAVIRSRYVSNRDKRVKTQGIRGTAYTQSQDTDHSGALSLERR